MNFDCTGYAYDWNDKHMSVCRVCKNELVPHIETNNTINNYVMAKSPGRPTQIKKLIY